VRKPHKRKRQRKASPGRAESRPPLKKAGLTGYVTRSAQGTFDFARKLAKNFRGDETVFLIGELGAGKTIFAKGLAAGLGLKDVHQVSSPSFTLMNVYQARVPIYHFDLFRLNEATEIRDLGFEDYLGEGVVIIEWAEKIQGPWPAIYVTILVDKGDRRSISIMKTGPKP
jgi:tRNA threonylcarbamoyladenosine biosynthesis protein TsaE